MQASAHAEHSGPQPLSGRTNPVPTIKACLVWVNDHTERAIRVQRRQALQGYAFAHPALCAVLAPCSVSIPSASTQRTALGPVARHRAGGNGGQRQPQ